jgi:hypothetical protein
MQKLEKGSMVYTHLTHLKTGRKGSMLAKVLGVDVGTLSCRVQIVKSGAVFRVPLNAIVARALKRQRDEQAKLLETKFAVRR